MNFRHIVFGTLLASLALTPHTSLAAPVSFGFAGIIDSVANPGGDLPAGVAEGQPFRIIVTYDPDLLPAGYESIPDPTQANYYTTDLAAFGYWARFGNLDISLPNPAPVKVTHSIEVRNGFGGWDGVQMESYGADAWFNQAPLPTGLTASRSVTLMDATMTAFADESLPLSLPPIANFQRVRRASIDVYQTDSGTGQPIPFYRASGLISEITNTPQPPLTLTRQANGRLRLSWPKIVPGFILQIAGELDGNSWAAVATAVDDTPTEYFVELPIGATRAFFRLHKD